MNSKRPLKASTIARPRKRPRCEDGRWYTRRKEHQFQRRFHKSKRRINRQYQNRHFTDTQLKDIRSIVNLHDGSAEANSEDNSLQNVLSNGEGERRLISVELLPYRISIFDSGQGMDGAAGNLEKWGKILASLHQNIGGEPPYSMPFFGMFGYGGPVAATCFGKHAVISSKIKNCHKVLTVNLERESSVSASCSENCWRTKGGLRDPLKDETEKSLHGSFTKVEILDPKVNTLDIKRLRCKLKDIFFPYIKCAEVSGTTSPPIKFQVNGIDLSEVQGGEEAVTNLHSCNGPDFVLQLHFSISQDSSSKARQNERVFSEANARLKCVYFPIVEGKENITRILDALDADGCGIRESFESFSRVSVRSLGRLLPDARWALLPFMEPKQKTYKKNHRTGDFSRVKCFIELVLKQIESKKESAAFLVCKIPFESRPQDILGVVALLGTVHSIELSRMLAEFLGEDQMLAIACRNIAAAHHFKAQYLGETVRRGYHVVCLEEIRRRFTKPSSDPQQLLPLEEPTLPNGNVPPAFLGYAVNMMEIEESHTQWRTENGYGLRETLFYCLFGELQVYKDSESMMSALSCFKDGALSLDGCIVRRNGYLSLGYSEHAEVLFPVRLSARASRALKPLDKKRSDMAEIDKRIYEEQNAYERAYEKLCMAKAKYNSLSQN